jgi:nitroreductase
MELMDAIYKRRAVRAYKTQKVDRATVEVLIEAAIQAPSAMNQQPWAFGVVQDPDLLARWSGRAKAHFLATLDPGLHLGELRDMLASPDFNIFYDAGTLILICAKPGTMNGVEDCCLAAENLMLAACSLGFGTCVIGLARPWLNLAETKRELDIPADYEPVLPIIVGYPRGETPATPRNEPEILFWKQPSG